MKFKSKDVKGVTVIALEGTMMGGPDASTLNDHVQKLVSENKKKSSSTFTRWTSLTVPGLVYSLAA